MLRGLFFAASLFVIATDEALAQTPEAEEEIIVEGERVPRRLLDTPTSVVVETRETINDQAAYDRLDQLLEQIPNLQAGSGTEGVTVRGQDSTGPLRDLFAFLGGTRPRITQQVDGRAVTYYEYVQGVTSIWDVDRVEVFRSPQTTTQGRNSIAGAIFVYTADPTSEWEGEARLIAGDARTRQLSALLSGPVAGDQVFVRVAGDIRRSRVSSNMADGIPGADINLDNHGLGRLKLVASPHGLPGARLEVTYVHSESQSPQFETVRAPFHDRQSPLVERTNGVVRADVDSITALLSYEVDPDLTSTTTISFADVLHNRFGLPGLGRTRTNYDDRSFETSLSWHPDGPLRLLAGIHVLATDQDQFIEIDGPGLRVGSGTFRDRQRSLGLFGEATWHPLEAFEVIAGLRYQRDSQERHGQVGPVGPGITIDFDETFGAWLPKLSIAYEIGESARIGLLVQRAYNPGGTTVSLNQRRQRDFDAESLWSFEAFARASLAGGAATFTANIFFNDFHDTQRARSVIILRDPPLPPLFTNDVVNVPEAESYGAEFQLDWRPSSRLSLRFGLGLLETEILRTVDPNDQFLGNEFARAPQLTAALSASWRPSDRWRLSAQVRTSSDYYSNDANDPDVHVDGATVVNARAEYDDGPMSLFGYVRNAFDNFYMRSLFSATFGVAGDPREVGAGLTMRF